MLTLYPEIEPFNTILLPREKLQDGQQHQIYIEQCGNPQGIPVVFLHGGPGSGCGPHHRRYFNPDLYHIILFDQRGCGRSLPAGLLENNDTAHLVADMEAIRQHLAIDKWVLFGGSWGATLALCYAREHKAAVRAMVLRGVFLGRQQDIDWVYAEGGASKIFSEAWHHFTENVPTKMRSHPLGYFFDLLQQASPDVQAEAANTLQSWEATIVKMRESHYVAEPDQEPAPLAHALIQLHFALNQCFIADSPLLESTAQLAVVPTYIIHGRYDMVCPVQQSWLLKQLLPHAEFNIVPLAGHAAGEPGLIDALVDATDTLAKQLL